MNSDHHKYSTKKNKCHLAHLVLKLNQLITCQLWKVVFVFHAGLLWLLHHSSVVQLSTSLELEEFRDKHVHQRCIHSVQSQWQKYGEQFLGSEKN